jgi:hypothetical protein
MSDCFIFASLFACYAVLGTETAGGPTAAQVLDLPGLALNTALLQQGVATSRMLSTVFDGVARHTPEGHAFVAEARERGFREAVKSRDEPYGDAGRKTSGV